MLWKLLQCAIVSFILIIVVTHHSTCIPSGQHGVLIYYAAAVTTTIGVPTRNNQNDNERRGNDGLSNNEIRRYTTGGGRRQRQQQQEQQRRLESTTSIVSSTFLDETKEYYNDAQASCSTDVIIHHSGTTSSYTGPYDNKNVISSSYTPMIPVGGSTTNIQEEATKFHNEFRRQSLLQRQVNLRIDDMLVTIPQNGKFIFLGQVPHHKHLEPELVMSLFNGDILMKDNKMVELVNSTIQYQNMKEHTPYKWRVIQPPEKALQEATQNIITLPEGPSEYVIFVAPWFFVYQHLLIDHIGIWSYLRDELLSKTKPDVHFVFVGSQNGMVQKYILEVIDPEFLNRITFLDCTKIEWCGYQMIQVMPKTKLSLFFPKVSPRHVDLLERARRWIFNSPQLLMRSSTTTTSNNDSSTSSSSLISANSASSSSSFSFSETTDNMNDTIESDNHTPVEEQQPPSTVLSSSRRISTTDSTNRKQTIIYCQRSKKGRANRGRIMNAEQETLIIDMIQDTMTLYGRSEQLVVFDGSGMTILEQIQLFQSASIVIGPHGGALANLLFTSPNYYHQDGLSNTTSTTTSSSSTSSDCSERTKVIEFVKSSDTRSIQPSRHDYALSFYYLYNTIPWIEYHQLYFVKPSNHNETFIDLNDLQDALTSVMKMS